MIIEKNSGKVKNKVISMNYKTPCYVIHEKELDDNFIKLTNALQKHWNNYIIGYSYKTNALPWIIKHFNDYRKKQWESQKQGDQHEL